MTQPERPDLKAEWEANIESAKSVAPAGKSIDTDDVPITPSEVGDLLVREATHIRDALLVPLWRLGRRYMRSLEDGVDEFSDGLRKKKDGDK